MRPTLGTVVGAFAFLLVAVPASAAVRYAEPGGDGPASSCPQSNPCDIEVAVEDPSAEGDEVIALPGTYDLGTESLNVFNVDLRGGVRGSQPVIESSSAGQTVFAINADIRDLELINTGGGAGLNGFQGAAIERVTALGGQGASPACTAPRAPGYIRDSVCVGTGTGPGLSVNVSGSGTFTIDLRNVTAIATGDGVLSYGMYFVGGGSIALNVDAQNVIAEGGVPADIGALEDNVIDVVLAHSNYDTTDPQSGATITAPGSGTNQTQAPDFVDAGSFDFRQLSSSPTVDAGDDVDLLGSLDFERQPRIQGSGIDIGADEFDRRLKLKAKAKKKQKPKQLKVKVRCPEEECYVRAKGRAEADGEKFKLKKTKQRFLEAGEKAKFKLKAKNLDELKSLLADGDGKAKIKVNGTDAGGVKAKKKLKVKLVG
jgi:hypothetical protein